MSELEEGVVSGAEGNGHARGYFEVEAIRDKPG
jgi:hypothetical protein